MELLFSPETEMFPSKISRLFIRHPNIVSQNVHRKNYCHLNFFTEWKPLKLEISSRERLAVHNKVFRRVESELSTRRVTVQYSSSSSSRDHALSG